MTPSSPPVVMAAPPRDEPHEEVIRAGAESHLMLPIVWAHPWPADDDHIRSRPVPPQ